MQGLKRRETYLLNVCFVAGVAACCLGLAFSKAKAAIVEEHQIDSFLADSLITITVEESKYHSLDHIFGLRATDSLTDIPTAEDALRAAQIQSITPMRSARINLISYRNQHDTLILTLSCPHSLLEQLAESLRVLETQGTIIRTDHESPISNMPSASLQSRKLLLVYERSWETATERYAAFRRSTGWETELAEIGEILARQAGRDDAEKLRNEVIEFSQRGGTAVLLLGDERTIPVRYLSQFSRSTVPALSELFPGDLYYADCNGNWNADNDSLWGEPFVDLADLTPELLVGRLPISSDTQLDHYLENVTRYEFPDVQDDLQYRQSVLFFSSDQMRDEQQGQHNQIARSLPLSLIADSSTAVESPLGSDLAPINTPASELSSQLQQGTGIVSVLAHGDYRGFVVRSSGINNFPKSKALASPEGDMTGLLGNLLPKNRPSFWHSIACDNGGYDLEDKHSMQSHPSMVRHLLLDSGSAIGLIAYSRWGWVNTSWRHQKAFFDSARTHAEEPASMSMYRAQMSIRSQLDILYGQNYYGDPTLVMSQQIPRTLDCEITRTGEIIRVSLPDSMQQSAEVIVSSQSGLIQSQTVTYGSVQEFTNLRADEEYVVVVKASGFAGVLRVLAPSIVTGIDDDETALPGSFRLDQNYPNPFNPSTTISFSISHTAKTSLIVYNSLGQQIRMLLDAQIAAGHHALVWDGRDDHHREVASGVYFYRLESDGESQSRTLLLLK